MAQELIIWDNFNLNEEDWKDAYQEWLEINEYDEDDAPMPLTEWMYYTNDTYLEDERVNLNKDVDGVIVAIADLGLWNGRRIGGGIIGTNVKDILYSECDYCKWYCDRWNVKFKGVHHDGRNYYTYRVVESREKAEELLYKAIYEGKDMKWIYRHSKSLRPYVAKAYGW